MFNLLEWWRTKRKSLPPGNLSSLISKLDAEKTPLDKRASTLRQYALSQLDKDRRNNSNGKG